MITAPPCGYFVTVLPCLKVCATGCHEISTQ